MNVAKKLTATDTDYRYSRKATNTKGTEVIYLAGSKKGEVREVTTEYLNEKLAYFYNNGGPIMDI